MFELHRLPFRARASLLSLIVLALSLPIGVNLALRQQVIDSQAKSNQQYYAPLLTPASPQNAAKSCIVTGCSGQLCVDANSEPIATTCEWHASYACYHSASCEVQESGDCGWTQTQELQQCLTNAQRVPQPEVMPYVPSDLTEGASL